MRDWKDRKVLVLGLGDTGWSMTRWLARHGARVSVADSRSEPPHARTLKETFPEVRLATGAFGKASFDGVDAIAISPGVDRREPAIATAMKRGVPVIGDIEIFAQALRVMPLGDARAPQVVAITGSNGKSTVTAMTGEIARAASRATVVAGNFGLPVLDTLEEIEEGATMPHVFVLELSSFQLETTSSLAPDAATVLNVTEDHLDRYDGIADYAAAKARIFAGRGVQVLNRQDPATLEMTLPGRRCMSFGTDAPANDSEWGIGGTEEEPVLARGGDALMPLAELPVHGMHNAANALAALALTDAIWLPNSIGVEALRRFRGLPHRLEQIAVIGGVAFYDDSKGTNVGATVAALNGMRTKVVLVAGGDGKSQDFSPLAAAAAARARAVVLIGRDAEIVGAALRDCGVPLIRAGDMEEAVTAAYGAASPGDAVLLSPACASYDMFRSYVHRADVFAQAVKRLAEREEAAHRG